MVYHNQYLYPWHVERGISPNEKLNAEQKKPVAYFVMHGGKWMLINQTLTGLKNMTSNKMIPQGTALELVDGQQILLSDKDTGRLALVQMVNC